jgi:thiol:disulfide interchange protein/DsbC/DsbD-like thiol-disulfide interchange protein
MRMAGFIFAIFLALAAGLPARAASDSAEAPHVHVQLMRAANGIAAPGEVDAGLYFKLENGWHVYWLNPGDAGQAPKIAWTLPAGVTAGPMRFPAPKRLPLGPLMDFGYEDQVLFPFPLNADSSVQAGSVAHLAAKVSWLVCRETCIPGKANLEFDLPVRSGAPANAAHAALISKFAALIPDPMPPGSKLGFTTTADGWLMTAVTGHRETEAQFFPADADLILNAAPQPVTPTSKGFTLELKKDPNAPPSQPTQLRGLLELSGGRAYAIVAPQGLPTVVNPDDRSARTLSQARATQGSAAPAPPEASPTHGTGTKTGSSANPFVSGNRVLIATSLPRIVGLAFLGGIILNLMPCVFPVLFLKGLALVNSGSEERHRLRAHGLVYTAGIVVSFWALVGVLLALRSAGARLGWGFQFQSPIFLSLMACLLFFLGLSLGGQFEIGLSLTSAGGSLAAKHGYTGSFFTGVLAVIVATPCTAPFMGAAIGYALAAPAVVTFAVFTALAMGLAAPYLALTLQPSWTRVLPRPGAWMEVLRQAVSVPIFGTVIWMAWVLANAYGATMLAALLVCFLLLAIAGWFLGRWPAKGWSTAFAGLIAVGVVGLSVYSGRSLAQAPRAPAANLQNGEWQPWSEAAVAQYKAAGRPVFVDFTASWCLSCQVNERVALNQPQVLKALADANVVLMRADWTQHDDAIAQELERLGRNGVPTYALYVPGQSSPRLLPEALTPAIVTDAVDSLPRAATQNASASSNLK